MEENLKRLLLKDLSARLPYHVRCKIWLKDGTTEEGVLDLEHNYGDVLRDAFYYNEIIDIKPYLRPMSNMTKKEKKKFDDFCVIDEFVFKGNSEIGHKNQAIIMSDGIDYLNSIHVDYLGLIPMGLAIEATEGMYNIN